MIKLKKLLEDSSEKWLDTPYSYTPQYRPLSTPRYLPKCQKRPNIQIRHKKRKTRRRPMVQLRSPPHPHQNQ